MIKDLRDILTMKMVEKGMDTKNQSLMLKKTSDLLLFVIQKLKQTHPEITELTDIEDLNKIYQEEKESINVEDLATRVVELQ